MILCFGTSLLKFGFVPTIVEQKTGHPSYNHAVMSGHTPSSYYLLKRSIESGAKPAAILLDCQDGPVATADVNRQAEAIRVNMRSWPEILTWREGLDFAREAGDAKFFADLMVSWLVPTSKLRHEIRAGILAALRGGDTGTASFVAACYRNWRRNRGACLMPLGDPAAAPPAVPLSEVRAVPPLPRDRYVRNRLSDTYADRFLSLAARHSIPVFWLLPPVPSARTPRYATRTGSPLISHVVPPPSSRSIPT